LSVDAGVEQSFGNWGTLGATWFNNSFRDLIDYVYSQSEPNYFNLARTKSTGVELEGRATLPAGFHADAAFTYLDARVVNPGASADQAASFAPRARLLRRPMHTLDAGAGYRARRGGLELRARRVGERQDTFFAPDFSSARVSLPAYTRADLAGDLLLVTSPSGRGSASATLRVENLFDAHYTDVAGFNYDFARTDEATLRLTGYRAPGRRVLVGVRVEY
jgi:vitamin B12 transporter